MSWQVEMTDGTEEFIWWGAKLSAVVKDEAAASEGHQEYVLTYEAQHGFGVEDRRVRPTQHHQALPTAHPPHPDPPLPALIDHSELNPNAGGVFL